MDPDYAKYLRASNGDGPAATAFLSNDRGIGDMSVITDNVLNWPSYFVATVGDLNTDGTVDVASIFLGHLEGSIVMINEFAPGYFDEGFSEGQVIFIKPASVWADIVAGLIGDVPAPHSSIVVKGGVVGAVNGTNKVFSVGFAYIAGSLQVYINGVAQSEFIAETDPSTGVFTIDEAPATGSSVKAYFHVANTAVGNADSIGGYQLSAILDAIFPVGSVYVGSTDGVMPPLIASIGTWVRLSGKVIAGVDNTDPDFAYNNTVGAKTHTLTIAQMPSHRHPMDRPRWWGNDSVLGGNDSIFNQTNTTTPQGETHAAGNRRAIGWEGGGQAHPIMQPTKAKYMWERTA